MNVGCFNVENCVDGEECGHNTGECVGCPSELRYGMDAAVGAFARHRNAWCYDIGTGYAEVTSTIVNTLYGWPEGFEILDARSRLEWPNGCSSTVDPPPDLPCTYRGYASVIPVLGYELDEYEDKCPGDWRIRSPGGVIFILTSYANETLAYHPDEGNYLHIGDEMVRSIRFPIPEGGDEWYLCPEDVPPDIIDQQIVCAKKSAREISDIMAQPCEAISP